MCVFVMTVLAQEGGEDLEDDGVVTGGVAGDAFQGEDPAHANVKFVRAELFDRLGVPVGHMPLPGGVGITRKQTRRPAVTVAAPRPTSERPAQGFAPPDHPATPRPSRCGFWPETGAMPPRPREAAQPGTV